MTEWLVSPSPLLMFTLKSPAVVTVTTQKVVLYFTNWQTDTQCLMVCLCSEVLRPNTEFPTSQNFYEGDMCRYREYWAPVNPAIVCLSIVSFILPCFERRFTTINIVTALTTIHRQSNVQVVTCEKIKLPGGLSLAPRGGEMYSLVSRLYCSVLGKCICTTLGGTWEQG